MRNIIPILKSLGLLESEVKTYLAALELGPSTVLEINKKIGLSRQAIYTAIESLIELGLMSSVEKGKKTLYTAESPERLRSFAEAKLKKMEATVREIKDISKDLSLIQQGDKPIVKMFEGPEGFIALREDIIKSRPKTIEEIANDDAISELSMDENMQQELKRKLEHMNAKSRVLVLSKDKVVSDRPGKTIKQIPNNQVDFTGDVLIYGNKVALSGLKGKMIGVIIESQEIAQTLRSLFELAWDNKK
ncbi:hypothetical protein GF391_01945 [Candidatus Uhrbacteria bacterium]|nr:hypothetical protein [Candidatus Uhrbacteria bacterium]